MKFETKKMTLSVKHELIRQVSQDININKMLNICITILCLLLDNEEF